MSSLMISVAGVRGIIGETLDPAIVSRFAAAFARTLPGDGPVVLGRDARTTGPLMRLAACAGITAAGRDVVDIGLATTPTTQMAVEHLRAGGGIILTASHNPAPWNALKFLSAAGEFLGPAAGREVRERFETDRDLWVAWDRVGAVREEHGARRRPVDPLVPGVGGGQREHVVELGLRLVEEAVAVHAAHEGRALEDALGVLVVEREQGVARIRCREDHGCAEFLTVREAHAHGTGAFDDHVLHGGSRSDLSARRE